MADIIYMGIRHWDTIKQRAQHLAEGLARSHRVIYVNPVGFWRFGRSYRTIGQSPRQVGSGQVQRMSENLYIYSTPLTWLPFNYHFGFVNRLNQYVSSLRLRSILDRLSWQNDLLWTSTPSHVDMITSLPTKWVCYDCMDLYCRFWSHPLRRRLIEAQEARLVRRADLILVSSLSLQEHVLHSGKDPSAVHLVRNAAQVEHFGQPVSSQDIPPELLAIRGPVAGYVGTLSHWFDWSLVQKLLKTFPDLSVVCVGPAEVEQEPRQQVDRLHLLGPKPYGDLPRYMARFDVLLIPFIIGELVQAVNPVKVYEYLATGKPIVATAMRELQPFAEVCYLAADQDRFAAAIGVALAEGKDPTRQAALRCQRRRVASENRWDSRVAQIDQLLKDNISRKGKPVG